MATKISKSEFIRKHPDIKAGALVELAKKSKIKLTPSFVYAIRSKDRTTTGGVGNPTNEPPNATNTMRRVGRPKKAVKEATGASSRETELMMTVIREIGTARARQLLDSVDRHLAAAFG